MMPLKCSVCAHPQALEITKAVTNGGSKRIVADRYELSPSAVHRHKLNCLGLAGALSNPTVPSARKLDRTVTKEPVNGESDEEASPKSLLRQAETLLADAQSILRRATATGNDRMALAAVREIRSSIELVMRAHEQLGDRSGVGRLLNAMNDREANDFNADGFMKRVVFEIADKPKPVKQLQAQSSLESLTERNVSASNPEGAE